MCAYVGTLIFYAEARLAKSSFIARRETCENKGICHLGNINI